MKLTQNFDSFRSKAKILLLMSLTLGLAGCKFESSKQYFSYSDLADIKLIQVEYLEDSIPFSPVITDITRNDDRTFSVEFDKGSRICKIGFIDIKKKGKFILTNMQPYCSGLGKAAYYYIPAYMGDLVHIKNRVRRKVVSKHTNWVMVTSSLKKIKPLNDELKYLGKLHGIAFRQTVWKNPNPKTYVGDSYRTELIPYNKNQKIISQQLIAFWRELEEFGFESVNLIRFAGEIHQPLKK